jgi:hypothetical protein
LGRIGFSVARLRLRQVCEKRSAFDSNSTRRSLLLTDALPSNLPKFILPKLIWVTFVKQFYAMKMRSPSSHLLCISLIKPNGCLIIDGLHIGVQHCEEYQAKEHRSLSVLPVHQSKEGAQPMPSEIRTLLLSAGGIRC